MKRVYICTPLSPGKFDPVKISRHCLAAQVFAFIPVPGQFESYKTLGALIDKHHIDHADELWAFGPIGRDCMWEIGYAGGRGIPVKLHIDDTNRHLLDADWMLFTHVEIVYL